MFRWYVGYLCLGCPCICFIGLFGSLTGFRIWGKAGGVAFSGGYRVAIDESNGARAYTEKIWKCFLRKKTPLNLRQELSQGPSLLAPVGVTISFSQHQLVGSQPTNPSWGRWGLNVGQEKPRQSSNMSWGLLPSQSRHSQVAKCGKPRPPAPQGEVALWETMDDLQRGGKRTRCARCARCALRASKKSCVLNRKKCNFSFHFRHAPGRGRALSVLTADRGRHFLVMVIPVIHVIPSSQPLLCWATWMQAWLPGASFLLRCGKWKGGQRVRAKRFGHWNIWKLGKCHAKLVCGRFRQDIFFVSANSKGSVL